MASNAPAAQCYTLGELADARGALGPAHSHATPVQMETATRIMTRADSYTSVTDMTVCCVEDRLHRPNPRLAGGAVSLALMQNFLYGGAKLSRDMAALQARGIRLELHDDCGALKLLVSIVTGKLSDVNAEAYTLLAGLGYNVPVMVRDRIAMWARSLPSDYADADNARAMSDEVDSIEGEHNAVFAGISLEEDVSFTGGPLLKAETGGLLAFAFDPWVAQKAARQLTNMSDDARAAEMLAVAFTAQVLLTLGGRDLRLAVHE